MFRIGLIFITTLCTILIFHTAFAMPSQSWQRFIAELREDALAEGIDANLFDSLFQTIKPRKRILHLDNTQPEQRITYYKYRQTRGDEYRIKLGIAEYQKHATILNQISKDYGVDPCVVVSLWGIESSYGRFKGNHPVITALATLAYDSRRSKFFRKELLYALHILNEGHVSEHEFKGEWAGGSGHPQFLPSSWHNYAVDHNGDGKKDIWNTKADVFASIANYLSEHGWQADQPNYIKVTLPSHFDNTLLSLTITKPVSVWRAMGIAIPETQGIDDNTQASIIQPDGGPVMMVFKNFKVIMKYNRSIFYAGTVSYMSDRICKRHTK